MSHFITFSREVSLAGNVKLAGMAEVAISAPKSSQVIVFIELKQF
jgi:hypothetical protein